MSERLTGRILLAEDDPMLRELSADALTSAGHTVTPAADGAAAAALVRSQTFDLVISDIQMPGMDGLDLLRVVRERDLDLPVVLVTGTPAVDSTLRAIEHGALRYLVKPVSEAVLLDVVQQALRLHDLARLKRQALSLAGDLAGQVGDRAGLEARFSVAMKSLWMAFQPIVNVSTKTVFAYEALLRSDEPALATPGALLDAAERLQRLPELGRAIRSYVGTRLAAFSDTQIFVNLHAADLVDDDIYRPDGPLARAASRVVLEITERAALDHVKDTAARARTLKEMGYRLAVDDLGAGYAGLSSFALLEPDLVKLDMSLVRDLHLHPVKHRLVQSMTSLCRDLGIGLVAEGVEKPEERDALIGLGCDLLQGYLFARPAREFPTVAW